MTDYTEVLFRNHNNEVVDRFAYTHPMSAFDKDLLRIFFVVNYRDFPGGCSESYNYTKRGKQRVNTGEVQPWSARYGNNC